MHFHNAWCSIFQCVFYHFLQCLLRTVYCEFSVIGRLPLVAPKELSWQTSVQYGVNQCLFSYRSGYLFDSSCCSLMDIDFQEKSLSKVIIGVILYWEECSTTKCIFNKIQIGSLDFRPIIGMGNVDVQPGRWSVLTVYM